MGKVSPNKRRSTIRARKKRKDKLGKLRELLSKAKSDKEKREIHDKMKRVAPYL